MKRTRMSLILVVSACLLTGCGSSSNDNEMATEISEPTAAVEKVNQNAKDLIKSQTLAYLNYNCTPRYVTKVTDFGDGITTRIKNMNVFDEEKFGIFNSNPDLLGDQYFLNDDPTDSTYGNLAIRDLHG